MDLNFSLTLDVVKELEAILRTPTFRLAKRFFDDVPMKLHFGLRDEEEAARMREIVERVGEVHAEVFVDVLRFEGGEGETEGEGEVEVLVASCCQLSLTLLWISSSLSFLLDDFV